MIINYSQVEFDLLLEKEQKKHIYIISQLLFGYFWDADLLKLAFVLEN